MTSRSVVPFQLAAFWSIATLASLSLGPNSDTGHCVPQAGAGSYETSRMIFLKFLFQPKWRSKQPPPFPWYRNRKGKIYSFLQKPFSQSLSPILTLHTAQCAWEVKNCVTGFQKPGMWHFFYCCVSGKTPTMTLATLSSALATEVSYSLLQVKSTNNINSDSYTVAHHKLSFIYFFTFKSGLFSQRFLLGLVPFWLSLPWFLLT